MGFPYPLKDWETFQVFQKQPQPPVWTRRLRRQHDRQFVAELLKSNIHRMLPKDREAVVEVVLRRKGLMAAVFPVSGEWDGNTPTRELRRSPRPGDFYYIVDPGIYLARDVKPLDLSRDKRPIVTAEPLFVFEIRDSMFNYLDATLFRQLFPQE